MSELRVMNDKVSASKPQKLPNKSCCNYQLKITRENKLR
ncbi:hypothetical protein NIES4074_56960 [Cylindrospermum sp. NIES-4074]|nr:hypothetical protein NIES4074_56960 [Cylindrospermum sp. NIES-4074]